MTERRTTITTARDTEEVSAIVVLAAIGLGTGLLALDHYFSTDGHSAFDRMMNNLGLGETKSHGTRVGADASEDAKFKRLPAYVQQVVAHALASEADVPTLTQLADNLQAAGFTQTAAQVRAKVHG